LARIPRLIVDTNTFVSAILGEESTPAKAVQKAMAAGTLLRSIETWDELEDVLMRDKFDRYRAAEVRRNYLHFLERSLEDVSVYTQIAACRHPKDDKFLALAIDGLADAIITGDADLLVLHPFREVSIITAATYLTL